MSSFDLYKNYQGLLGLLNEPNYNLFTPVSAVKIQNVSFLNKLSSNSIHLLRLFLPILSLRL
jgi:hypothetical protein